MHNQITRLIRLLPLALLLLCRPALSDELTGPAVFVPTIGSISNSGSINSSSASVVLNILGTQYATARFAFTGTLSSQTLEFDYSIDGVNWLPSGQGAPYVKRIDAVSANPSVVFGSTATVGGNSLSFNINTYGASTWELPLAGNVQAVRLLPLSVGAGTVAISAGLPYAPGIPVVATLFDVTSVTNTAIDTGTLNLTGWSQLLIGFITPAGGSGAILPLDDTGVAAFNASVSFGAAATSFASMQLGSAGASASAMPLPARLHITTIAVAGLTSHIRAEASRGR